MVPLGLIIIVKGHIALTWQYMLWREKKTRPLSNSGCCLLSIPAGPKVEQQLAAYSLNTVVWFQCCIGYGRSHWGWEAVRNPGVVWNILMDAHQMFILLPSNHKRDNHISWITTQKYNHWFHAKGTCMKYSLASGVLWSVLVALTCNG